MNSCSSWLLLFHTRGSAFSIAVSTCSSPLPRSFCFGSSSQLLLLHEGKPNLHRCFHKLCPATCQDSFFYGRLLRSQHPLHPNIENIEFEGALELIEFYSIINPGYSKRNPLL